MKRRNNPDKRNITNIDVVVNLKNNSLTVRDNGGIQIALHPDYKYIVNNKRVHKSRYKKSRLNTNLTESQATKNLGINRIYDCGKIKFEKVIYR